jgi:hypothetical protein
MEYRVPTNPSTYEQVMLAKQEAEIDALRRDKEALWEVIGQAAVYGRLAPSRAIWEARA